MKQLRGAQVGDYGAPLFLAWQLTNRCVGRCLHCCEESGPDKAWKGELTKDQALDLSRQIVAMGIPYVAFGGGEPLDVPHVWEIFEILHKGGVSIKLETNGLRIDDAAAERLKGLGVDSLQISIDGATAATHEKMRPESPFGTALEALKRVAKSGLAPELVFSPTRINIDEVAQVYDLAVKSGVRTFVTGPLMRLGRSAFAWDTLAPTPEAWERCEALLREKAKSMGEPVKLAIYPWGVQEEMRLRCESPQAMVLVVPDGKVKLLNALPFAGGDLKKQTLAEAWQGVQKAWKDKRVSDFVKKAQTDAGLLRHANECWMIDG